MLNPSLLRFLPDALMPEGFSSTGLGTEMEKAIKIAQIQKRPKNISTTNLRQNSVNDQKNYEKSVNSMKKALFMLIALVLIALVLIIQ